MKKSCLIRFLAVVLVIIAMSAAAYAEEMNDPEAETVAADVTEGNFSITKVNGTKGTFKIKGSGISAPSGIKSVKYRVWRNADKSDRKVYTADGSYAATVDVAKHKYHFGTYKVEMIVTPNEGTPLTVVKKRKITAKNYIYALKVNKKATKWRITVLNAKVGKKWARSVVMPTWSKKKGKTDLIRYKAKKIGKHNWRITMNTKKHVFAGKYFTKVLGNGKKKLGTVSYKAKRPLSAVEKMAEARLNKIGRNLRAAFRWSVMRYRGVNTAWRRDPDKLGSFGLSNHRGDCGVMAATFYQMARRLGYDVHFIRGYCRSGGGGITHHAWVEIKQNGHIRVYDPDLQSESGRNGFHLTYSSPGTWGYYHYQRIK